MSMTTKIMLEKSQVGGTVHRMVQDQARSAKAGECRCEDPVLETIEGVTICHKCGYEEGDA